jgi:hypothetical protein
MRVFELTLGPALALGPICLASPASATPSQAWVARYNSAGDGSPPITAEVACIHLCRARTLLRALLAYADAIEQ